MYIPFKKNIYMYIYIEREICIYIYIYIYKYVYKYIFIRSSLRHKTTIYRSQSCAQPGVRAAAWRSAAKAL